MPLIFSNSVQNSDLYLPVSRTHRNANSTQPSVCIFDLNATLSSMKTIILRRKVYGTPMVSIRGLGSSWKGGSRRFAQSKWGFTDTLHKTPHAVVNISWCCPQQSINLIPISLRLFSSSHSLELNNSALIIYWHCICAYIEHDHDSNEIGWTCKEWLDEWHGRKCFYV